MTYSAVDNAKHPFSICLPLLLSTTATCILLLLMEGIFSPAAYAYVSEQPDITYASPNSFEIGSRLYEVDADQANTTRNAIGKPMSELL